MCLYTIPITMSCGILNLKRRLDTVYVKAKFKGNNEIINAYLNYCFTAEHKIIYRLIGFKGLNKIY